MNKQTTEPCILDLQFRGCIEGKTIKAKSTGKDLCHYFGGIPYALPPVGAYRWRRPRPLAPCYRYGTSSFPADCTGKSSVCPQPGSASPLDNEDCLQCNIYVPAGQAPMKGMFGSHLIIQSPSVTGYSILNSLYRLACIFLHSRRVSPVR